MPNNAGRQIGDASFSTSKAFPAAAASASSSSFDLGKNYLTPSNIEGQITWPALAALADTKNVVFVAEHSDDDSSYSTMGITRTITGAGGAGVAKGEFLFRLPSNAKRYVRVTATEDSAGGNITASSFTFALLF
jgi:hypothetical protein